jgi:hypothetical protein
LYYNTGVWRRRKMKKRWFICLIIGIIMITGGCLGYLQFGRDMDVYGSHAMTADNYHEERLTVVVNKLYVADQKACAEEIVKRCRENSFKSVRFSYDQSIPNALYVTVYASKRQAERGKQMFSFSYLPQDSEGTYNIIDDSEEFILEREE